MLRSSEAMRRKELIRIACRSLSIPGQAEAGIGASEAEAVGKSNVHDVLLGGVGHVVAVEVFRRVSSSLEVQGRRKDVLSCGQSLFVNVDATYVHLGWQGC